MTIASGIERTTMPDSQTQARRFRAVNRTRGTVLADQLDLAGNSAQRSRGLLGRDGLAPGEGLWIVPCESVHTFFMRFPIDLVYLDREHHIRKIRHSVSPWRISASLLAHSVLELPPGSVRATRSQRGDLVELVELVELGDSEGVASSESGAAS